MHVRNADLFILQGATLPEIKKVYKKLSLVYHPDKAQAGTEKESEERFIQISKAYQVYVFGYAERDETEI